MMKKIGITQRVEVIIEYGERRDCLDQNWIKLLIELGYQPIVLPNIAEESLIESYFKELELDGVILTGGNDLCWTQSPKAAIERDQFETKLIDHCCDESIPVLGVCRGMQLLNIYFGGALSRVEGHVTKNHEITINGGVFNVNSYHQWGIKDEGLSSGLKVLGRSKDGYIELFRHQNFPFTGMMWHPERDNQDAQLGIDLINEVFV